MVCVCFHCRLGWENHHHHLKPTSIQNPKLVFEQTKGHHRRQIRPIDLIQFGLEIAWRFGTFEENPCPSWYASLLGSPCPWPTHQNNRSPWSYRRCVEEEVNILSDCRQPKWGTIFYMYFTRFRCCVWKFTIIITSWMKIWKWKTNNNFDYEQVWTTVLFYFVLPRIV